MKRLFWSAVLAFILSCPRFVQAQEKTQPGTFKPLTLANLSLIDGIDPISPACLLSLEVPLATRWGLKMEGGYISSFGGTWMLFQQMQGYKARLEARWYIEDEEEDNFYAGIQAMHKRTFSNRTNDFCRQDCQFIQRFDYKENVTATALHLSLGGIFFLSKRFLFDLGGFGGVRYVHRYRSEIPDDATIIGGGFTVLRRGKFWIPSAGLTFRVGLAWEKGE